MSPETAVDPVGAIARRVKQLRGRRGWTAADLGAQLKERGVRWDRFTVANLESGKRQNVTVVELLALADALGVAVVNLLVPITDEPYRVTAGDIERVESSDVVREWVRGNKPLPGTDTEGQRTFYAEVAMADIQRRGHIVPLGTAYDTTEARDLGDS
jgi:transcriptional regulator with XRE-family HTH domain